MESVNVTDILMNSNLALEKNNANIVVSKHRRISVCFPACINLETDLLRALYLFWGDGSYIKKIHFTNKEPELHLYILEMFERYFSIARNTWRLRVLYNECEGDQAEKIKIEWLKQLNFEQHQLYPKIAITGFKCNENGNGRIIIDKLTYCDFLRHLISYVNSLIENKELNENQLVAVLDGILNAEGSAHIDSIGLHKIVITLHEKEVKFVRNILSQLNIDDIFVERQGKLTVMGWRNLYKFVKLFAISDLCPFSVHNKRKSNAINGFLNHKRTGALYNYLSIIEENEGLALRQLARIAKRDPASAQVVVLERLKEFTNVSGGGIPGKRYKILLSDEGREFLQVIRKLKEWR